ncbi:hypothetical protein U1Q18_003414 [Sarracenia purpurea var. burkii]
MASLEARIQSLKGLSPAKIRAFPAGSPVPTVAGANLNGDSNSQGEEAYTKYDEPEDGSPHMGPAFASIKGVVSSINGEEMEIQLEICPRGDVRSYAKVPEAPKSKPEVSFIEEAEVADGDEVGSGVSDESDGSICFGDSEDAEDETEPNPNGNGVSVTEVKTGEGINNQVISESSLFLNGDCVGAVALKELEDSGVKVKQARDTTVGLCSARHVFDFLPNSPPGANPESRKVKAVSPIFPGPISQATSVAPVEVLYEEKLENEEEDGSEEESEGSDEEVDTVEYGANNDHFVKEEDETVGVLSPPLQIVGVSEVANVSQRMDPLRLKELSPIKMGESGAALSRD